MAATYEAIIALVGQMDPSLKKVTDQAKKELEALEKKAGKSSKGFGKDGLLGKAMKGFGTVAKKALKAAAVGTAAAASGVAVLAKQSLDAYANYEQLVGGVDTLFKGSSKQVQDYANAAYKTAGLSANNYMQTVTSFSASLINSLGGDTAKAADMADMAVTDMADNANKMGTPIEDIQRAYQSLARGQYGMLDNLKLGFGGTKGEMEKLIAKANEYEKANGRAGDLSIDKFSDVVQAIHDVQEEMGITGTTALEASTTIEGSVNSMKAAWENWLTGLANEDADLGGLTDQLLDSVQTVASNVMPRLQTILSRLGSWLAERGPTIIQQLVTGLSSAVTTLIPIGAQVLMSLAQGIVAAAPQLLATGFQLLIFLAQGIVQSIPQILTLGMQLIAAFAQACAAYLPTLIPLGVQAVLMLANGILQNIPQIIAYAVQIIVALAQGIAAAIPMLIEYGPQIIYNLVVGIISGLGQLVQCGWEILGALAQGILDAIGSLGGAIWDALVRMFTGQPLETPEVDTSATEASMQTVPDAAQSAADQASSAFSNMQIEAPEMPDIGDFQMPDTSGMSMDFSGLSASASGEVSNVNSILSGIGSGASVTVGSADFSPITQAAQAAADTVRNTFTNLGTEVTSALSSGTAGAGNSFTAIVTSAQSAATSVTAAFTGVGAGIGAAIAAALAGASSGFATFAAQGTSSAMQVQAAQSAAAMMVMSLWTMALMMVSSRALATVSAFMQMSAAGTSAAGAISGSMSGVAGNISSITSAAYAAVGALNAMASAARSASAAAASASAAKAVGFAHGGFTSGPSVAGEDPRYPTEAVISFNPAYRAQNKGYVMRAAQMLGMSARAVTGLDKDPWTLGGELANSGAPITSNLEMTTTVNVGGITFAPNIEIKGNASRDDIIAALRKVEPEFAELVRDVVAENEVGDYAFDAT